ncbi:hypothetical protein [Microcoleus sp.]|uniref:hypothetical protein n=1 Tax=Microcoleus sp. TaxID=44472 RepID=UPI00403E393C
MDGSQKIGKSAIELTEDHHFHEQAFGPLPQEFSRCFSRYQALPGNEYREALPPFKVRKSVFYGVGLETIPALILSKSAQVLRGQWKIKFSVLNKRKLSGS